MKAHPEKTPTVVRLESESADSIVTAGRDYNRDSIVTASRDYNRDSHHNSG